MLMLAGASTILVYSCDENDTVSTSGKEGKKSPRSKSTTTSTPLHSKNLPDLRNPNNRIGTNGIPIKVDINAVIAHLEDVGPDRWNLDGENGGYLLSLFYWCDQENSDKALSILARCSGDATIKRACMGFMIKAIFDKSSPETIDQARLAIKKHFGDGLLAGDFTSQLYQNAGITPSTLNSISLIKDAELKKAALAGLSLSLKYSKNLDDLSAIDFSTLDDTEARTIGLALAKWVSNAAALGLSTEQTIRKSSAILGSGAGLISLLGGCVDRSPEQVWEILASGDLNNGDTELGILKMRALQLMAAKDAPNALKSVLGSAEFPGQTELLSIAMSTYLQMNDVEARLWFENNKESLQPAQLDGFEASFARFASMKKNFADAWKQTEGIDNPELKRKIEGDIWQNERKSVIAEVGKDPQAFIEKITAGNSQHAPYWIETAIEQWVARDGDGAWTWYEDNRSSLTPEQNEAVALAYARQALKTGQPETAAEWAKHVVTPKFEAKIRAEIEAAAKSAQ